jgi:hypothetical protein
MRGDLHGATHGVAGIGGKLGTVFGCIDGVVHVGCLNNQRVRFHSGKFFDQRDSLMWVIYC